MEIWITTLLAAIGGISTLAFRFPDSFERLFRFTFPGAVVAIWIFVAFITGVAVGQFATDAKSVPGLIQPIIWWLTAFTAALFVLDRIKPK